MGRLRVIANRLADRVGGSRILALMLLRAPATGLGLSISYGIVVDVRSTRGDRTTFVLMLRRVRPGDFA